MIPNPRLAAVPAVVAQQFLFVAANAAGEICYMSRPKTGPSRGGLFTVRRITGEVETLGRERWSFSELVRDRAGTFYGIEYFNWSEPSEGEEPRLVDTAVYCRIDNDQVVDLSGGLRGSLSEDRVQPLDNDRLVVTSLSNPDLHLSFGPLGQAVTSQAFDRRPFTGTSPATLSGTFFEVNGELFGHDDGNLLQFAPFVSHALGFINGVSAVDHWPDLPVMVAGSVSVGIETSKCLLFEHNAKTDETIEVAMPRDLMVYSMRYINAHTVLMAGVTIEEGLLGLGAVFGEPGSEETDAGGLVLGSMHTVRMCFHKQSTDICLSSIGTDLDKRASQWQSGLGEGSDGRAH